MSFVREGIRNITKKWIQSLYRRQGPRRKRPRKSGKQKKQDTRSLNTQFKDLLKADVREMMILKIFLPAGKFLVSMTFFTLGLWWFLTEHFEWDNPLSYRLVLHIAGFLASSVFLPNILVMSLSPLGHQEVLPCFHFHNLHSRHGHQTIPSLGTYRLPSGFP